MRWWDRQLTPMKIGTVPAVVRVHSADLKRAAPGRYIRIQESENAHWTTVRVTNVNPDGCIFADR